MGDKPAGAILNRHVAVTRHAGAAAWMQARCRDAEIVPHLDPETLRPGDVVMGTLPVNLAAAVIEHGATFQNLSLDLTADARGRDLTPDEMDRCGARLEPYDVQPARLLLGWRLPSRRELGRRLERFPSRRQVFIALAAWTLALGVNLLSMVVWDAFVAEPAHTEPKRWLVGAALVLGSAVLAGVLYRNLNAILSSRITRSAMVPSRAVLVMGLSPLPEGDQRDAALQMIARASTAPLELLALSRAALAARREALLAAESANTGKVEICDTLLKCGQRGGPPFPWQQNLRVVNALLPGLRGIIVIPSPQSQDDYPRFELLLRQALHGTAHMPAIVPLRDQVPHFEHYEELKDAFTAASRLARRWGAKPHEICIDVTAGQKIFSIAGAIATLNCRTVFTYVNNAGEVAVYDASIEIAR